MSTAIPDALAQLKEELGNLSPEDEYLKKLIDGAISVLEKERVPPDAKTIFLWLGNRHENAGREDKAKHCRCLAGQIEARRIFLRGMRFLGGARFG